MIPYDLSVYDAEFYVNNSYEQQQMVPWLMPLLRETFHFQSFIDFGCGLGWYVRWCRENCIVAIGVEGSPAALLLAQTSITQHDLREPLRTDASHDVALCLEVAEHIEKEYAGIFVDSLIHASPVIVMTAARPGQGGLQHVNEQPDFYWIRLFGERGYRPDLTALAQLLSGIDKAAQNGGYVTPWLRPNLMVFRHE